MHKKLIVTGFTLIELAISMFIISLIIGGGFATVGAMMERAQVSETRQNLDQFKQSVLGFISRTQRLPKYTGSAAFPPIEDDLTGLLPRMADFWGMKLIYLYDPELARSDFGQAICSKRTTNITLRTCTTAACSTSADYADTPNIAFVVFSSGKNITNQTDAASSTAAAPLAAYAETAPTLSYSGPVGGFGSANQKIIKTFFQGISVGLYSAPTTNPQGYDDMLVTISLDELRQRAGCSATPLRLVNTDLPMATQGATYSVDMVAEGGVPISATESARWCIESADTAIGNDLVFQIRDRTGADYATPRIITRQVPGTCTLSTTLETNAAIWGTGDTLRLKGATGASGLLAATGGARTRTLTVFVRDNQNNDPALPTHDSNDNIVSRAFVVPINGP